MVTTSNIAFAIPSDVVSEFVNRYQDLKQTGKLPSQPSVPRVGKDSRFSSTFRDTPPKRRFLGLTMATLYPEVIKQLAVREPAYANLTHGLVVMKVVPGSPAAQVGLKEQDVIINIDGQKADHVNDLYAKLERDSKFQLQVRRGTQLLTFNVVAIDNN